MNQIPIGPQRIVCLTEETTETLYLLGEDQRIVGEIFEFIRMLGVQARTRR